MKKLMATIVAIALVALTLGWLTSPASATGNGGGDEDCTYEWSRTIPGAEGETEYRFAKFTRERTRTYTPGTPATEGQHYSWTGGPIDFTPPAPPAGNWQANTHHEPHGGEATYPGASNLHYTGEPGQANWFYYENGTAAVPGSWGAWSAYGEWTKWSPEREVSWQDSTTPLGSPQFHGSGTRNGGNTEWERQWQAMHDGQTRIKEGTATDPIVQGPVRSADEPDRGEYPNVAWVKDGDSKECAEQICPADFEQGPGTADDMWEITWGQQVGSGGAATFNMQSNGGLVGVNDLPVPGYMGDPATSDWTWLYVTRVSSETGRTVTYQFADGTERKAVVSAEEGGCPVVVWTETPPKEDEEVNPPKPVWTDPCGPDNGSWSYEDGEGYSYEETVNQNGSITVRIVAEDGYVFPEGTKTQYTKKDSGEECPTKEPKVEYTQWVDGQYGCDDTTVEQTRTKSVTTYVWNSETGEFDSTTVETVETQTRDLTEEEMTVCPIPIEAVPTVTLVDECGVANDVGPTASTSEEYTSEVVGNTVVFTPVAPYFFPEAGEDGTLVVPFTPNTGSEGDVCEKPDGFENSSSSEECVDGDLVTTESTETGTPVQAEDGTWSVEVTATSSQSIVEDAKVCAPDEPKNPEEPKNPAEPKDTPVVPTSVDAGLPAAGSDSSNNGLHGGVLAAMLGLILMGFSARKRVEA